MQHECFRAPVKKIKLFKNNPTINKATSTNEPAESATVSNKSAVKSSTIAKSFPITPLTDLEISAMNEIIFNENPNCATTLHHFGRHEPITQVKKKVLSSEERRCIEILFNHQHSDFLDEIVKFELGSNPLQECCENSLNELQGDFVSICEKSKLNYSVWHKERKFRITGSVCYGIFTYTKNKSPDWVKKCEQLISPKNFKSQFTEDGKLQEKHALKAYKDSTKERVEEFGLICSRQIPWLAYSPDGIIFKNDLPVALIEIKCPFIGERCWYQRHH